MTGLKELLDIIQKTERISQAQLADQTRMPLPMLQAMLDQLERMGKIEHANALCSNLCKSCPESAGCHQQLYRVTGRVLIRTDG